MEAASAPPPPAASSSTFGLQGDPEEKATCERLVGRAFQRDFKVQTLRDALAKLGVATGSELVRCEQCPADAEVAGGFVPSQGQIVLCQQWVAKQPGEVENTLAHEMVHAYDDARAYLDWTNLTHQACTEIRAAHLSGDCTWGRELDRGNVTFRIAGAGASCVRRRAELSVSMNPACPSKEAARKAVEAAWGCCARPCARTRGVRPLRNGGARAPARQAFPIARRLASTPSIPSSSRRVRFNVVAKLFARCSPNHVYNSSKHTVSLPHEHAPGLPVNCRILGSASYTYLDAKAARMSTPVDMIWTMAVNG